MQFQVSKPFPIVRVTLPLDHPRPFTSAVCPFTVMSPAGVKLKTQWETVSLDADGNVRVAELLASNPQREVGIFSVLEGPLNQDMRPVCGAFADSWISNAPVLERDGVRFSSSWGENPTKAGSVCSTRMFYGHGFKGWVSVFDGCDFAEVVLDVNQGEVSSPNLFFGYMKLVGAGHGCALVIPESPDVSPTGGDLYLAKPRSDGKLHVLPQRSRKVFRLVLHDGTQQTLAQQYASGDWWGCAPVQWHLRGGFQPHSLPLPDLAVKISQARSFLSNLRQQWFDALFNGTSIGIGTSPGHPYPAQGSQTDWMHPCGQQYGGATSGSERYQYSLEGVLAATCGIYDGIFVLMARASGYAQRMPSQILDVAQRPAELEDFVDPTGKPVNGWRMSSANTQFDTAGGKVLDGPFGYSAHSAWSPNACNESLEQVKYDELDFQHQDRWYQLLTSLVYLTNDPWAAWQLRCSAETWRMSMFSGSRMKGEEAQVHANPHNGTDWGRAHGECWAMCCAAYAVSSDRFRRVWKPWLARAASILLEAQMPNGLFRSSIATSKDGSVFAGCWDAVLGKPIYSVTKVSEEAQLPNFLQAYLGSVVKDDPERLNVQKALVNWGVGMQDFLTSAFPAWAAVGPPDKTSPRYLVVSPLIDSHKDKEEVGAGLGYAVWAGKDVLAPDFGTVLRAYTVSPTPLVALLARPVQGGSSGPGLDDTAPLIAALQIP